MLTADVWPALPENPTWIFVVCLALVVGFLLVKVGAGLLRAYTANQQVQIDGLRKALDRQDDRHREEITEMRVKIERLEATSEEARTERHKLRGDITNQRMALGIIRDLYTNCTCGALDTVGAVLNNLATGDI